MNNVTTFTTTDTLFLLNQAILVCQYRHYSNAITYFLNRTQTYGIFRRHIIFKLFWVRYIDPENYDRSNQGCTDF